MLHEEYTVLAQPFYDEMERLKDESWVAWLVRRQRIQMRLIIEHGINPVYEDFNDFLFDFWPNFSWNEKQYIVDCQTLLADAEWNELAIKVKAKYGYDFVKEVNGGLAEALAD